LRNPWIDQVDPTFKKDLMARMQPQTLEGENGDLWRYAPGQAPQLLKHGMGHEIDFDIPGVGKTKGFARYQDGQFVVTTPYGTFPLGAGSAGGAAVGGGGGGGVGGAVNPNDPLSVARPFIEAGNAQKEELARLEAMGKAGGEAQMAPIAETIKEAKTAPNAIKDLNIIEDTVRNHGNEIVTGPLADTWLGIKQFLHGSFGVDIGKVEGLPAAEIIKKMNAQLASAELPAFTARGTQFDLKTFMANNPGLSNSPEGTLFLTSILKQYHRQTLDLAELASDRNNWENWQQVQKNYLERHPLINPLTGHELGVYKDTSQQGKPTLSAPSINLEIGETRKLDNGWSIRRNK
jgi:hypothetical protein